MGDVLTGKVPGHDAEVHIERPDGSRVIVIVNIAPLKDDQGEITGVINCFYDVTGRKQAEGALRESVAERRLVEEALRENEGQLRLANEKLEYIVQKRTASLRHLSSKLMRSQDEEHRRIARNLHDSLGQDLTSIKLSLESLRGSDVPNKDEVLSSALESVERSIAETRPRGRLKLHFCASETAWRRAQSGANLSTFLREHSLLTGKNTGNFTILRTKVPTPSLI
jgi:hypothetical protein